MQCKNHPSRRADHFCASCGIPLCKDCAEEAKPGAFYCFQCAMLTSVSEVGTKIKDRREKAAEERLTEKKKWGPFRYFILVSTVFIAVMWGVILFGGESIPAGAADVTSNPRAFLFMVDSSVKRFAHYEKSYPKELKDLVPKYLRMRKENVPQLNLLSYQADSQDGYHLSLAKTKPGEMVIILTSKGIQQKVLPGGGSR